MKIIILTWIAAATVASAFVIEDSKGFSPVLVQVVEGGSGTPIKGAIVRLEGAGSYREVELDPMRQTKALPESLGKPVTTNSEGVGIVFFYGGFSSTTSDGKTAYFRPMVGIVVVEYDGKEIFRSSLADWAKKNNYDAASNSAPWIVVSPPPKEKNDAKQ